MHQKYLLFLSCVVLAITSDLEAANHIKGQILDSHSNDPIIGANIIVVNTNDGAASDVNGYFDIRTDHHYPVILNISHIAYENAAITITFDTSLVIQLHATSVMGKSIVITGERSSIGSDVSTAVELIKIEQIENLGARDIGDVLRPLSSVAIRATNSGKQHISIRGSNANEVAVFLDGLRLNDTNTGVADLSAIDLNDMEQVEVVKGGSSTLFGQGAFGGILNLTSQLPDSNRASYTRAIGETDAIDQDLAYGGSARLGRFAIGGNYSGKSRRYDGNSIYTSMFQTGALAGYLPWGNLSLKRYKLEKYLEMNTGMVAQSDAMDLEQVRYSGSIFNSPDWEFFAGRREWNWVDRFFTNLERDLDENTTNVRVAHKIVNRFMNSTLQYDYEEQNFASIDTYTTSASDSTFNNHNDLGRYNHGFAAVLRIDTDGKSTGISKIRWEVSLRADKSETTHLGRFSSFMNDDLVEAVYESETVDITRSTTVFNRKFGVRLEGSTSNFYYSFFVNQGHNRRPPSLNDLALWANALASDNVSPDAPIKVEALSTTDIGAEIIMQPPGYEDGQLELIFGGNIFVNEFANKIAYRYSDRLPPVPLNTPSTQISGYELSAGVNGLDRHLNAQVGFQRLKVDDPRVYPNKPEYRISSQVELQFPWIVVGYDYYKDGPQFVLVNGLLSSETIERESSNVNILLRWKLWKTRMSLGYTIRNIFKDEPSVHADAVSQSGQPFEYYETHRRILTFRVRI